MVYKSYSHDLQKLLTWFTKVTHMVYKSYSHVLQKLLTWFTKVTHMVYKSYSHDIQKLLTWFTKVTHMVYKSYSHGIQKVTHMVFDPAESGHYCHLLLVAFVADHPRPRLANGLVQPTASRHSLLDTGQYYKLLPHTLYMVSVQ